ncbi:hypothetical protein FA13DRAFT_1791607 [Coprinellus micaceus]|uniref:Uncharacterized protein n=1 Tax=Coprinellus micaceus TaxID=71717 RepID=A0A4Y7TBN5_COPMI|nr:hypothetical protein FA13DRAFT_1791607 [Coprinellus micaceus]
MDDEQPAVQAQGSKVTARRKPCCKKCGHYMEGHGKTCKTNPAANDMMLAKRETEFDPQSISCVVPTAAAAAAAAVALVVQQAISPSTNPNPSKVEHCRHTFRDTQADTRRDMVFNPEGRPSEVPAAEKFHSNVKLELEHRKFSSNPVPGTYQSDLGLFLDATSTKVTQLPDRSNGGEWAFILARRQGSLEVWALSPEGSVALLGGLSRRRGFDSMLGMVFGVLIYILFLVYLY